MAFKSSDPLRRYKRFLKSFLQLVKKTKSPMSVPLVHTLFVATSSILLCMGIGLPNWVAFKHIYEHCNNEGYSGLWVACSKHCTVDGQKWMEHQNKVDNGSASDPFEVPKLNCTGDKVETCYNFEQNQLVEAGPLQATRVAACASAFLSFVALGFAIVRWLQWGQIDTPSFTLIMVVLSVLSGLAGIGAGVAMPFAGVNQADVKDQSKKLDFIQHGLIMFGAGALVNIIDAIFMLLKGNTPKATDVAQVQAPKPEVAADEAEAPPEADEPAAE